MSTPHYVPKGFHTVTPYLMVPDGSLLLDFMKKVFDAEEVSCVREADGVIRHASVRIGDSMVEFSDASEEWKAMPSALHIYVEDPDAVYQRALQAGATSLYEPTDHFYGERSGGVKDPVGNNWYIAKFLEELSEEEMERRKGEMMSK